MDLLRTHIVLRHEHAIRPLRRSGQYDSGDHLSLRPSLSDAVADSRSVPAAIADVAESRSSKRPPGGQQQPQGPAVAFKMEVVGLQLCGLTAFAVFERRWRDCWSYRTTPWRCCSSTTRTTWGKLQRRPDNGRPMSVRSTRCPRRSRAVETGRLLQYPSCQCFIREVSTSRTADEGYSIARCCNGQRQQQ